MELRFSTANHTAKENEDGKKHVNVKCSTCSKEINEIEEHYHCGTCRREKTLVYHHRDCIDEKYADENDGKDEN